MPNGFVASSYDDRAIWMWKGREREYQSILGLVKSIDLLRNKLVETIPREILKFDGLIYLNLSRNHLTGRIPLKIGFLQSLDSLDLSKNRLCDEIPSSISLIIL